MRGREQKGWLLQPLRHRKGWKPAASPGPERRRASSARDCGSTSSGCEQPLPPSGSAPDRLPAASATLRRRPPAVAGDAASNPRRLTENHLRNGPPSTHRSPGGWSDIPEAPVRVCSVVSSSYLCPRGGRSQKRGWGGVTSPPHGFSVLAGGPTRTAGWGSASPSPQPLWDLSFLVPTQA